jgi:gliding motility-associated-like protein
MKKDELENLFKDSFENFEADVNPSVWKNVQTGLKGAGLGAIAKMLFNKIGTNAIVAIVSSAAAVLGTVLVMNGSGKKPEQKSTINTVVPKVVADTQKPTVDEIKNFLSNNTANNQKAIVAPENDATSNTDAKNNISTITIKKDKKQIQSLLSGERVASISTSCVGGAVPLLVNLTNIGTGKINKWSFNDGTKPKTEVNPIKYFAEPGIYTIVLTSTNVDGITETDSVTVEALANSSIEAIPAEFTPNGDGKNDVFVFNSQNIKNMTVAIFDKDGKVVYEYKGTGFNWDGKTQKGEKAKEGIYLYMIAADGKDGKKYEQKGKIKLAR